MAMGQAPALSLTPEDLRHPQLLHPFLGAVPDPGTDPLDGDRVGKLRPHDDAHVFLLKGPAGELGGGPVQARSDLTPSAFHPAEGTEYRDVLAMGIEVLERRRVAATNPASSLARFGSPVF